MIDRTTFDLRIADHGAQAARANRDEWQRPGAPRHQGAPRRPLRMVAAVALGLGLLTGVVVGRASADTLVATHWTGPADEYTLAEGGAIASVTSCVFASVSGAPGEGCGPTATAVNPDRLLYDGINPGLLEVMPGETRARPVVAGHDRLLYDGTRPGLLELLPGESPHAPFVADQFTYREDHQASATGFLPGVTGLVLYA